MRFFTEQLQAIKLPDPDNRCMFRELFMGACLALPICTHAFCFDEAGAKYGIEPRVLRLIAKHESNMKADTLVKNTNGSWDIGLMGVNTVHFLPGEVFGRMGLSPNALLDPCVNVQAGAYLLKTKMLKHGTTWLAVGAYHSETPEHMYRYINRIYSLAKSTP